MTTIIRFAFIGCGQVNFGQGEGPWDHARRLQEFAEKYEAKYTLKVVGVADPFVERAHQVVAFRRNQKTKALILDMWKETKIYANFVEMLDKEKPELVFIGVPPESHGSTFSGNDIEVQCLQRGIHMFIEKPISCYHMDEVLKVGKLVDQHPEVVVSVGYMFRYALAIQKMKQIVTECGPVKAFNARYNCAYSTLSKDMWWDVSRSGGPIVEQATHFCDLARYLVGDEVDLNSVHAISIKQTDKGGDLASLPKNVQTLEQNLPPDRRIPRVTSAFWKFKNGAIGTLMHAALLHEVKYEAELEIWGDGYRVVLIEPYGKCRVAVRLPHKEDHVFFDFEDDMYFTEIEAFLLAVKEKGERLKAIRSPYHDAIQTYQLTWAIKTSAESNLK